MIHNRYLPSWLHRIGNGLFGAVLLFGFGSIWISEPAGTWRHLISLCLIGASLPAGIILAFVAHRFSIVRGVAGEDGYDELHEVDAKPPGKP